MNWGKGRGELRGFDRISTGCCRNSAGRRGGKEWIEGVGRKEIERREQGGWVWLCLAVGVDEDGRNGSTRTDGRGMVAGNSGRSEICRGDEIRGEERLSDGGRWVKLLVVGFRPGRLVREGDRWS